MWHVVRHLRENQNDDVVKDSRLTVGQWHDVLKCWDRNGWATL